ncbi:transglycosylase domain-containing protein [Amphibacillus xylanus]|uniref:Putative hydrolase n=1 Tax=Amphibacillus xylanus (strain ATCC 51415 / DSM 6626 / JCM 7361 / LMG 17667 / NBRC 15112 / Ep01) TaxID=698758 RepID=K0J163_AMPXN|nr:transglycosylase domain-containing protein [Amphibacillus xylanus]BAM46867.1 putative hydrolase [Amphibacillus xylanus NBRC 15112]
MIIFGGRLIVAESALILPATTQVITEDGEYAGRLYQENRQLVKLGDIPEHVQEAFIAIEDQRFYSHAGVDFRSVMRAVYRDLIALDKVEDADQYLGRVVGEGEFTLSEMSIFDQGTYYIVPYNPLTDQTGTRSNTVRLSLLD